MIEVPCPTCGQKTIQPDRPEDIRTFEERIAFEREWDRRWKEAKEAKEAKERDDQG